MGTKHFAACPTIISYLTVSDTKTSIALYQKAFGFKWLNEDEVAADGTLDHVEMQYKDVFIMFAREGAFGSTKKTFTHLGVEAPNCIYLYCDDVDQIYTTAIDAGMQSLMEPNDAHWGDRVCMVKDHDGYEWMFAKHIA
ncbi:MAG: VOC family protein [Pseudomonadota bacterium]